jgi:hypothetical protein
VLQRPGELGEGVGADAGLLTQDGGRGGGRRKPDHGTAVLGPGEGEGAHGGGLPGASGGDRELQPSPGGAHLADQWRLPNIECSAVGRHFEQCQIDRHVLDRRAVVTSRRDEEAPLGVEDPLRGVKGGASHCIDRGPVDPPQHLR